MNAAPALAGQSMGLINEIKGVEKLLMKLFLSSMTYVKKWEITILLIK